MSDDVHVTPCGDHITHDLTHDCVCGPTVEWIDPDTGMAYPYGAALVTHHSL